MDQIMAEMAPLAVRRGRADLRIAIIGAGFAGIGAAITLRRAGFDNITIFERAERVGGTWRDNTYPGAACDVPSHLYSFSFAPKHDWAHKFSSQKDILAYIEDVVDRFDLARSLRLGASVRSAHYDEAMHSWQLETSDGQGGSYDVFIPAVGQLSMPIIPAFKNLSGFQGAQFHSARWDHSVDLAGKRVAVVGSAASAVQIVPELTRIAASLSVFQRAPNWIIPRNNHAFGPRTQALFRKLPFARRLLRGYIYMYQESLFGAFRTKSRRNALFTGMARKHVASQVSDPELRRKLTPTYTLGCKRLLVSDDYLPCFNQPHVELVTDTIAEFSKHGIRTVDGAERIFDAVIFATGFDASSSLSPVSITGRDGATLQKSWEDGPHAYHGVATPGFPNMFFLYGPNTNLGHSSIIFMLECQFRYITTCVARLADHGLAALEIRKEASDSYNVAVQSRLSGTVWSTGCGSWYGQNGKITANWSGSTTDFWRQMRRPRFQDFIELAW